MIEKIIDIRTPKTGFIVTIRPPFNGLPHMMAPPVEEYAFSTVDQVLEFLKPQLEGLRDEATKNRDKQRKTEGGTDNVFAGRTVG